MAVINTNISALKATNSSNSANKALSTAMERLSTGKRINSAKDDAAGLAIATTMTAQIKGMSQGVRNANDGISLAQTAEGALNEVTNMLQRVRELAVQSKSATYQQSDRDAMQSEVANLTQQISDVLNNTKFNGQAVFKVSDGTDGTGDIADYDADNVALENVDFAIQTGANTSDTVTLVSEAFDGSKLFGTNNDGTDDTILTSYSAGDSTNTVTQALDVSSTTSAETTIDNVDEALAAVNSTRATFGAGQNRLESAVNNLNDNITNLSDARSRIEDTDYSSETTAMAKAQILSQASTAMIAQANQSQQNVLSLLR